MKNTLNAFCYRSGQLKFAKKVPEGVIIIAENITRTQRDKLAIRARMAYDNKTLLVPGIPEADSDDEALDALHRWKNWATKDFQKEVA